LLNTDNSTNIATTAWTNNFWTYVKTNSNTWSGTQNFSVANVSLLNISTAVVNVINASAATSAMTIGSNLTTGSLSLGTATSTSSFKGITTFTSQPLISSTAPANTDNSTNIATTAWVNSFWSYVKGVSNTYTADQNFSGANVSLLNISTAAVNVINAGSAASAMTIGSNLTTGTLSLGSANASTTILGSLRVDSILPISGLSIGNIAGGTGSIQIGNGTTQTTNIIIGNGAGTVTGSDQIVIGKSGKVLVINASTTISGTATTINPTGAVKMIAGTDITLSAQNNYIGPFSSLTQIQSYKTLLGGADVKTSAVVSVNCTTSAQKDGIAIKAFDDTSWYLTFLNAAGTACGSIRGLNGSEVNYYTASDRRLKTDIRDMDRMMDNIMKMKPSNYTWISSGKQGRGFIAQEVFEIFPEMRNEEFEGTNYYGLDYSKFTPYLVKAFQELKTDYETKIAGLEARLSALEHTVESR
jgi:hypothetical protein